MSHEWSTPQSLFDALNREFSFDLDVCATADNAKCSQYFDANALERGWSGTCWMNPPYGREISRWIEKAYSETRTDETIVVALLPNRSNAPWWHEWVMKAAEIRFIRRKVPFVSNRGRKGVPFYGSLIAVFRNDPCGIRFDGRHMPIVRSQEQFRGAAGGNRQEPQK